MVDYVLRPDDPQIPPPYEFPGITIRSFQLQADLAKLQALCDRWLNIGSVWKRGFEYRSFLDSVDMEIVSYPKMVFSEPPYCNWGFASQQELYFRFFVWKFLFVDGCLYPSAEPELFFPFMFVDNSWSMISGRNIVGYPKVLAQFTPSSISTAAPWPITASALAMQNYSPSVRLDWHPVVTVAPDTAGGPTQAPAGNWPWIQLGSAIDPVLQQLWQSWLTAVPVTFSTVQLKQFRDAPSLTAACYQAVVAVSSSLSNIQQPVPLPPATITVNKYASLDIPAALGIQSGAALKPLLQYSVNLDMKINDATNIFVNRC